jgi:hypothetical protein
VGADVGVVGTRPTRSWPSSRGQGCVTRSSPKIRIFSPSAASGSSTKWTSLAMAPRFGSSTPLRQPLPVQFLYLIQFPKKWTQPPPSFLFFFSCGLETISMSLFRASLQIRHVPLTISRQLELTLLPAVVCRVVGTLAYRYMHADLSPSQINMHNWWVVY